MRRTSGIYRWGLLILLTFAVMVMHHAPGLHDQAHEVPSPAGSAAQTQHHRAHDEPVRVEAGEVTTSPATTGLGDETHGSSSHDVLHLCLTIMLGFALLLFSAVTGEIRVRLPRASSERRPGLHRFRPALPVPRRLAMLCVLRL
ncbi:hypothetical protein GIY23_02645 [Allosaccharopolyspora coralli]|uniref:Uncharacterized protein n=1 Tax=Allosaccharopolyspora coralli TaxID=2665642 RepID=A0A5Q3Q447_9PSEU|nr:hypothetical protein [Allosaccharopolyspora coralli]QGK68600.1 hypothetical protein GIY23_02645 [Allosaccharopolyspora coralli]